MRNRCNRRFQQSCSRSARLLVYILVALAGMAFPELASTNPQISSVITPSSIGMYSIFEAKFSLSTVATNKFWTYETVTPPSIPARTGVTVEGLFSCDNWASTITVPGFYFQDYVRNQLRPGGYGFTDESVVPSGDPGWRVRFAPNQQGTWRFKIRVTDDSGVTTYPASGDVAFQCTTSNSKGFVRVSPSDSRYFEMSDGTPVVGCGLDTTIHNTFEADSIFATYGANGVGLARYMMNFWLWQNPFGGGDYAGNGGGPWWNAKLVMDPNGGAKAGDRYSAKIVAGSSIDQYVALTSGVLYRFTGWIKTDAIADAAGLGVITFIGGRSAAPITGTRDWQQFSMDFTADQWTAGSCLVGIRNTAASGVAYVDDLSLKASTDGGSTWSAEYLSKGDFDFESYVDTKEAWKVDRILDAAALNNVYIKLVVSDKMDSSIGRINADGTTGSFLHENVYGSAGHPSRWLWKAWWRYCVARWGAYTCIHSWEVLSEGDPFNYTPRFYDLSNQFADYMHSFAGNTHLATTSFFTSIPMDFWKTSSCDYLDVHEYIGPQGYTGPRCYPWADGLDSPSAYTWQLTGIDDQNILAADWNASRGPNFLNGYIAYDTSVPPGSSSLRSLKQTTLPGFGVGGGSDIVSPMTEYHVGIDPTHTYTLRFWAKAQDVGRIQTWTKPGVEIVWSKAYHSNDFVNSGHYCTELGTYDWVQKEVSGIGPPAAANTANIHMIVPSRGDGVKSYYWIDNIEFVDDTTGRNLYVGGSFEDDRIDYDSALATAKYGALLNSYAARLHKPAVWAETGINGPNIDGTTAKPRLYKGYTYTDENQKLVDDVDGIHIKKMIWAHVGPDNPNMFYWWNDNITRKSLWHYFKAFRDFFRGIPVTNGHYQDAKATVSNTAMRAWGQKDTTGNRAHLWIDNSKYTWKNVVDGVAVPAVSGAVTVLGLANGSYRVEWWDTSSGTVVRREDTTCVGGRIQLSVANLQSDIACKILPSPARVSLRVTVPSGEVIPGQVVTVTVEFTSSGETDSADIDVVTSVPAQMDYVAGSAEESGGTYRASDQTVRWTVARLAAHETGTRTFRARVR